ncbi:hypothetical protein KNV08_gp104 [Vibrio phage Quinn]|uniref:Uncharacterized protein n=1 Tax=Vibrio phage Quinn TaxID=2736265 RepID=A0A6M9Z388_9CAUD|nr:hypothetical protein KNV08_gp008 [Vibrio phage Quinn]YP_010108616.1 hypothetical protein KNV08_gp104 [Vibrio phage Quinn]QKN85250.1 hypothetical protein QUINN_8 [Vibrio phage Quinn]QKN85430.1 hypothetical protein QUINN_210 [Vibrio phage Quinn]
MARFIMLVVIVVLMALGYAMRTLYPTEYP